MSTVERVGNRLIFPEKINWGTFRSFNSRINELPSGSSANLIFDFSATGVAYPNGLVPLIATAEHRLSATEIDVVLPNVQYVADHFLKSGWLHFLNPTDYPNAETDRFRYGLHRFTEDTLNDSVSYILEWLLRSAAFAEGVHPAIEWMISELSGNVFDHAEIDHGWMQVTLYQNNNRISAVICDSGIGIPKSMRAAFPELTTDISAIQKASEKAVTSKPSENQGNGIAGSIALAKAGNGRLLIASGQSHLIIDREEINPIAGDEFFVGTIVELQLDIDKSINIMEVFAQEIGNRRWAPIPYLELKYENDEGDLAPLQLASQSRNFGNRSTGARLRNLIENLLVNNKKLAVLVDFDGVSIISSSFADEIFGKLVAKYGVWEFSRRIRVKNVNPTCNSIIAEVVEQRIAQKYANIE